MRQLHPGPQPRRIPTKATSSVQFAEKEEKVFANAYSRNARCEDSAICNYKQAIKSPWRVVDSTRFRSPMLSLLTRENVKIEARIKIVPDPDHPRGTDAARSMILSRHVGEKTEQCLNLFIQSKRRVGVRFGGFPGTPSGEIESPVSFSFFTKGKSSTWTQVCAAVDRVRIIDPRLRTRLRTVCEGGNVDSLSVESPKSLRAYLHSIHAITVGHASSSCDIWTARCSDDPDDFIIRFNTVNCQHRS